jgi:CheY-like chemotaxis protein
MGLATVHGIVHEHGGHVVVDTALGRGTEFRVLFTPLAHEPAGEHAGADRSRGPARKPTSTLSGRVLVVDDEEMVGEFMGDLLANWGLEATVVNSALEARDMFAHDPGRFDLVLTDQTMPKLTGLELAGELRGLRPDVPVILYTGYSENIGSEQLAQAGVQALVKKPIDPPALFTVLRKHLGYAKEPARRARG